MRHTCHALGCERTCPPKWLMCRNCWRLVPRGMQAEVYRTVSLRGDAVDKSWAPWWRAQARAIQHVAALSFPDGDQGMAYLERELAFADKLETRE